jgi:hypothetical protein
VGSRNGGKGRRGRRDFNLMRRHSKKRAIDAVV